MNYYLNIVYSRMRSEGFLFLFGGFGGGTVFVPISGLWPRTIERPRTFVLCPMYALRIGLEGGRLGGALWRRAVEIAGESLVWVALCRCCVVSCYVILYRVLSCLILSLTRVVSRWVRLLASRVGSRPVALCCIMYVMSCRDISCHVMLCHDMT